jgi:CubicO group peptidase (beta-lactamase class C family)
MNRTHLLPAVAALVSVLAVASPAAAEPVAAEPSAAQIDAYLAQAMRSTALPGLSIVVTHGDHLVHATGSGHDSAGKPITAQTPMRVASLSKSFTAAAVMTLVDSGKVALDEPVARQLPEFRMADPRASRITVRQLLNQTSGLADGGVDLVKAESSTSLAGYIAALRSGRLTADPGTRWAYCNVNYEVAARLVEVAGGVDFGDYLHQHVFGPLGMSGSALGDRQITPARGYDSLFGLWVARDEIGQYSTRGGSGGVVTDASDMGRWLISQTGNGPQLVRPDSLAAMHTPVPPGDYGMGWGPEKVDGADLLVHSGNLFTYSAVEAIVPATGYGFAVMTNSAGLYDDTYDVMTGLVALSQGTSPGAPGGSRQRTELILGLITLAAAGLGPLGAVRARRWAGRRAGRSGWRTGLRLVPALLPLVLLALAPQVLSFIMNGRTVTWAQLTYFPAPLTLTLTVAAAAGLVTTVLRLIRLRSVTSVG